MNDTAPTRSRGAFTIVTKSYLSFARVMAKALRNRHPGIPFYVFLADAPENCFNPEEEPFVCVLLEDYFPAELMDRMPAYYTAFEFCNALKPFGHLHMASHVQAGQWLYLDSDIFVCGDIAGLFSAMDDNCSILLTSHILKVSELTVAEQYEISFLRLGIFNGGFVGINNTPTALRFLNWWKERLICHCLNNTPGIECDQLWLNLVPVIFPEVKVLLDPGVNVAYWNLHERTLELDENNEVRVSGVRIPFLHFSGWNWRLPEIVTRHAALDLGASLPAWNHLRHAFHQSLLEEAVEETSGWPYTFARSNDGELISEPMRRKYLDYCRQCGDEEPEADLFSSPELFRQVPSVPLPIGLKDASRIFAGAIARALGFRKHSHNIKPV